MARTKIAAHINNNNYNDNRNGNNLGVAICKNAAHRQFIMTNLTNQVKNRRLVPAFAPLPKPGELLAYERTSNNATPLRPAPLHVPKAVTPVKSPPPPAPASSAAAGAGSPGSAGAAAAAGGATPALNAFGSVMF